MKQRHLVGPAIAAMLTCAITAADEEAWKTTFHGATEVNVVNVDVVVTDRAGRSPA